MGANQTPTSPVAQQGLASCAEAQAYLKLSRTTFHNLERRGALTPVRIGRSLRFRWVDLRRLAGEGGAACPPRTSPLDRHMAAALPPAAAKYLGSYIGPADAFIAYMDGLTVAQARSRARNAARSFGSSWPDRMPSGALVDPTEMRETQRMCGPRGVDPFDFLCAIEAAREVMEADGAAQRLRMADMADADTRDMSDMFRLTQRLAQQVLAARRRALDAGQGVLL